MVQPSRLPGCLWCTWLVIAVWAGQSETVRAAPKTQSERRDLTPTEDFHMVCHFGHPGVGISETKVWKELASLKGNARCGSDGGMQGAIGLDEKAGSQDDLVCTYDAWSGFRSRVYGHFVDLQVSGGQVVSGTFCSELYIHSQGILVNASEVDLDDPTRLQVLRFRSRDGRLFSVRATLSRGCAKIRPRSLDGGFVRGSHPDGGSGMPGSRSAP
jgi:hypothetical protein